MSMIPSPSGNDAAEYRQEAQNIRAIAQEIWLTEACQDLLETAHQLEARAADEERRLREADSLSDAEPET
jgi:hypothetical protein